MQLGFEYSVYQFLFEKVKDIGGVWPFIAKICIIFLMCRAHRGAPSDIIAICLYPKLFVMDFKKSANVARHAIFLTTCINMFLYPFQKRYYQHSIFC